MAASVDQGGLLGTAADANVADCCNDLATFLETGQACKSIAECGHPVAPLQTQPPPVPSLTAKSDMVPAHLSIAPSADWSAIWRPPTST